MSRLNGQPSPAVGEARAALEGIAIAAEKGWPEVILESDCALVTAAIDKHSLAPYGPLVDEIISCILHFQFCSCFFVKRSGNRLAHALAHLSLDNSDVFKGCDLPADLALIIQSLFDLKKKERKMNIIIVSIVTFLSVKIISMLLLWIELI